MAGSEVNRLRWRCRRGMKEIDLLLMGYLERRYAVAPAAEQQAFATLLELPDPELAACLLGRSTLEDPALADLIARIASRQPAAP